MNSTNSARVQLISSMLIFGTIGIFVRNIPLSSGMVALVRGVVGTLFLLLFTAITGKKISKKDIKNNLAVLIISGVLIGFNWVLLFEAYKYTTVAVATLCYYMAPVFVILLSPVFLKEKLSIKKIICSLVAIIGMVFVSGITDKSGFSFKGIALGLGAAALYASVIMLNQKLKDIKPYDKTIMQLGSASAAIFPYVLLSGSIGELAMLDGKGIALLTIVGIVHTGFAYAMYFGSMKALNAQTVAIFSYIDPIFAVILSAVLLKEPLTVYTAIGALLILGSTLISEIKLNKQ